MTIFFDVAPEIGLSRLSHDKKRVADRLDNESENFHHVVYETFLQVCDKYKDRIVKIDASKSINEVKKEAYKAIKEKLNGLH